MNKRNFQQSALWLSAFNETNHEKYGSQCNNLSSELIHFRKNIEAIVARIAYVLPELTIHDITHLDALWDVASLIAGDKYPLNPLEAFVFGGAVLLHDSAMCWEAYVNGQEGVRSTVEWRDAYAAECDRNSEADENSRKNAADFSALRSLHAHQASELNNREWTHTDSGQPLFLIKDPTLRNHIGELIGKIASSHHWDIDELRPRLGDQINAPSSYPSEWRVDPVKIACLLRCADAAHINQDRAPDFLYALISRSGISKAHWQAQNKLSGPDTFNGDTNSQTILYTSTTPFSADQTEAWWIAFDAISIVDAEIKAANRLLNERRQHDTSPPFKIKQVLGANSASNLMEYVRAKDWLPCSAQIHVSNIESLVSNLGGEKLYGESIEKAEVVVRELIQNARDAIIARKNIEPKFEGCIEVKLINKNSEQWLLVEDNGIGMSYSVLTGPLLDFGTSFWKTSLVQKEFPGLRSSKFNAIGRFGIGFYSTFMIADTVEVISKRYDAGLDETNSLKFNNGLSLRPTIRRGRPEPEKKFSSSTSTQVYLKLKPGTFSAEGMKITAGYIDQKDFHVPLTNWLSALVIGLDVKVVFESDEHAHQIIHTPFEDTAEYKKNILKRLSFAEFSPHKELINQQIELSFERLRPLKHNGLLVGCAAIVDELKMQFFKLGRHTIGGLMSSVSGNNDQFIGYINHKPHSARREATQYDFPQDVLNQWLKEQIEILLSEPSNVILHHKLTVVAPIVCNLHNDPYAFGRVLVVDDDDKATYLTYREIVTLAETKPVAILFSPVFNMADPYVSVPSIPQKYLIKPLRSEGKYAELLSKENKPIRDYSLVDCLHRAAQDIGLIPEWTEEDSPHRSSLNIELKVLLLKTKQRS
jgi:hypothetical protein